MASPAWLAQQAQQPVPQIPVSGQPTGDTPVGSSTSNSASTPPGAGMCTLLFIGLIGIKNESIQETAFGKFTNATEFLVPALSVSYSVHQNANVPGNSQSSSVHSVSTDLFICLYSQYWDYHLMCLFTYLLL